LNFYKADVLDIPTSLCRAAYFIFKKNRSFIFSFIVTLFFFWPALKHNSINAGFLYTGDIIGWYLPALAKTQTLIHSFHFTAIDFSAYNGSSDFFLSPNFFAYHPIVVLYCLLVSPSSIHIKELGHFLVLLMAFHTFLASYFSIKLFTRFFSFSFSSAALVATVFAFSDLMVNAMVQPPFFFCATVIPWSAYYSLAYAEKPTLRLFVIACLPIIFGFMGGYIPLGVACIWLSGIIVLIKLIFIDSVLIPFDKRIRSLILAALPYACATLIIGPYLFSVYRFHQETSSAGVISLFYSAHQLAQLPQSLLKFVSSYFAVPGKFIEFSIAWGFVAIAITAIFLLSQKAADNLDREEWTLLKISALIYAITVLATFGDFCAVSDLVYYLIPQVGEMHIYQRFLLPVQLVFAIMIALMMKAVIQVRPKFAIRFTLAIFAVSTIFVAYIVAYKPLFSQQAGLNNHLILELLIGFIFASALITPGKNFIYFVTIFLLLIMAFTRMYGYSNNVKPFEEQKKRLVLALDNNERARLVSYLKYHFGNKKVVKYVDITPMWGKNGVELFPKVFPYFVLNEMRLSSYGGFTFYLSAREKYMRRMPIVGDVSMKPDWELVNNSGADFIVARKSDFQNNALTPMIKNVKKSDVYELPHDVVIIPLLSNYKETHLSAEGHFDNGFFKILPSIGNLKFVNIAKGKSVQQSSTAGRGIASLAVDGNTDGNFADGSVSHTGRDVNAWIDIDLEKNELIGSLRIWNRTDCCSERLNNFWVFISKTPFLPSDTASTLRARHDIWSRINPTPYPKLTIKTPGVKGRYIRVQLGGSQPIEDSYLSIAEVQVFRPYSLQPSNESINSNIVPGLKIIKFDTNFSDYIHLKFKASAPTDVEYLFFDNPRLKYYLNGVPARKVERDGLICIEAPAGDNTIEVKYRHWPLKVFWFFYSLYALILLYILMTNKYSKYFIERIRKYRSIAI
jgi:NedA-like, galactose-binding domain